MFIRLKTRDIDSGRLIARKIGAPRQPQAIDSLAVIPFVNVTTDPNSEFLSDGITESLINSLSQLPKLRVVPRSVVFRYKGKELDPQMIGRDLNVRAVLTGGTTCTRFCAEGHVRGCHYSLSAGNNPFGRQAVLAGRAWACVWIVRQQRRSAETFGRVAGAIKSTLYFAV